MNDAVVRPVVVLVPVTVVLPVFPANIPVPTVDTVLIVTDEVVAPVTVPFSVKVPNTVPPAKTSTNVPLDMKVVRLVKMRVPVFVAVKAPDTESIPEPVKLESKTAGLAVGVKVEFPVTVPDTDIVSA